MELKVKKLSVNAKIPTYGSSGASGFDLYALTDVTLYPSTVGLVSTGLSFEIPEGYEMQIRPRSGLSFKTKLRIANSPGTIDSDYRGHVQIIAENISHNATEAIHIKAGDRIAQGVLNKVERVNFREISDEDELSNTERGQGGFGSTGVGSES